MVETVTTIPYFHRKHSLLWYDSATEPTPASTHVTFPETSPHYVFYPETFPDRLVERVRGEVFAFARKSRVYWVPLPDGEFNKTLQVVDTVNQRVADSLESPSCWWVFGGGTLLDTITYAAGMRNGAESGENVTLFVVPTTVLAAVDVAVGGRGRLNSVDATGGEVCVRKNVHRCNHIPRLVHVNTAWWEELPPQVYREGLSEAIKTAVTHPHFHQRFYGTTRRMNPNVSPLSLIEDGLHVAVHATPRLSWREYAKGHYGEREVYGPYDPNYHFDYEDELGYGHEYALWLEEHTQGRVSHGDAVLFGLYYTLRRQETEHRRGFYEQPAMPASEYQKACERLRLPLNELLDTYSLPSRTYLDTPVKLIKKYVNGGEHPIPTLHVCV